MLFHAWALRIFMVSAVFFPRDLLEVAEWIVFALAALEVGLPDIEILLLEWLLPGWDDE